MCRIRFFWKKNFVICLAPESHTNINISINSQSRKTRNRQFITYYSNHLNTWQVWYLNGRIVSGCQIVQYSNGGLKTGLKKGCLASKMSGIQMVCQVMWLCHLNTGHPYCPVFRWIWYSGVRYSDGYCTLQVKRICYIFLYFGLLNKQKTNFTFKMTYANPLISYSLSRIATY